VEMKSKYFIMASISVSLDEAG